LPSCPTEANQRIVRNVITLLDAYLLDCIRHILNGDRDEAAGNFLGGAHVPGFLSYLSGKRLEQLCSNAGINRLVAVQTEDFWKRVSLNPPKKYIAVGHGQRSAVSITGRPRIGPGRLRTNTVATSIKPTDRAATSGDSVYGHHRRPQAHPGNFCIEHALIIMI